MDSEPVAALRQRIATLEAQLAERDAKIETLARELEESRRLADDRWQAIERLAPVAKRLRIERDKLRAELAVLTSTDEER